MLDICPAAGVLTIVEDPGTVNASANGRGYAFQGLGRLLAEWQQENRAFADEAMDAAWLSLHGDDHRPRCRSTHRYRSR